MTQVGSATIQSAGRRSYSAEDIRQMIPHRWPMLLLDRAHDVVPGVSGRGVKNVSVNEPFFAGHYPDQSIMPGVLIVEAMAQLVAVVYVAEVIELAPVDPRSSANGAVGYLGAISSMKFSRLVIPGDQLLLEARLAERLHGLRSASVRASVGRDLAAAGTLIVSTAGQP